MGDPGSKKHLRQKPTGVDDGWHETDEKRVVCEGGSEDGHDSVDVPKAVSHEEETDVQGVDDSIMAKILRHGRGDVILRANAEYICNKVTDAIGHRCCE